MAYYSSVLKALAEPSRQEIVEALAERPMSVRELTDRMSISQPAISQHLDILRRAHVVQVTPRGASNVYSIDPEGLGVVRKWLDRFWDNAFDNYAKVLEQEDDR